MNDQPKSNQDIRKRVRQHLREALASGTLGGMALGAAVASAQSGPPMVCDPLPPPIIRCEPGSLKELGQRLQPHAYWHEHGQTTLLRLFVGGWRSEVALGEARIRGGTLVPGKHPGGGQYEYVIRPDSDAQSVMVTIPVPCRGANAALRLELDVRSHRGPVPLTLIDDE